MTAGGPELPGESAAEPGDARLLVPAAAAWAAAAWASTLTPALGFGLGGVLLAACGWALSGLRVRVGPGRPPRSRRRGRRPRSRRSGRRVRPGEGPAGPAGPAGLAVAAAVLACGAAGLLATACTRLAVSSGPLSRLARAGAGATVDVTLTGDPIALLPRSFAGRSTPASATSYLIPARASRVRSGSVAYTLREPVLVLAAGAAWGRLLPSTRLRLAARLAAPRPGDTVAAVVRVRGQPSITGPPCLVQRVAGRLRQGLRQAAQGLPTDEAGLLPGLVDGDTSALPTQLRADFQTTGLTHLVAVSGSNVAAVLAAALFLTGRLRLGRRRGPLAAALLLVGFVVLARPSPSVLRAAVMGLLAMAALLTGRTRPALAALAATVLVLVLFDPPLATAPGFALSTLASAALLVLAPGWRAALIRRGVGPRLAGAISVPLAAQLVCGPVIAVFAGSVSLVSVFANLLAIPAVPSATVAGVLAAVAAPVNGRMAALAAQLAGLPCWWLVRVARLGAAVPGASAPWPTGTAGGLSLLALSVCAVALARRLGRRLLPVRGG